MPNGCWRRALSVVAVIGAASCGGAKTAGPTAPGPTSTTQASLSGVVSNAAAGPQAVIASARVEIILGVNVGRSVTTDSSGRYRFENLAFGTMTIRASASGYFFATRDISLAADQSADFGLTPSAGPSTSGRAFDALTQTGLGNVSITGAGILSTPSDTTGAFTVASANGSGDPLAMTFNGPNIVERVTYLRIPGPDAQVPLIPAGFDLRAFDEMCRATHLLRWTDTPPVTIENRLLQFANVSETDPLTLTEQMSQADHDGLVTDFLWALPQMTGSQFQAFAEVVRQTSDPGVRVHMLNSGRITVARYSGLTAATGWWGYSRWQFRSDGTVTAGLVMLDRDFDRAVSPYRRSLRAHELGHALGYSHVTLRASVMNQAALLEPNDFDRDATRIVFLRPPGNRTPDIDPATFSTNLAKLTTVWSAPIR